MLAYFSLFILVSSQLSGLQGLFIPSFIIYVMSLFYILKSFNQAKKNNYKLDSKTLIGVFFVFLLTIQTILSHGFSLSFIGSNYSIGIGSFLSIILLITFLPNQKINFDEISKLLIVSTIIMIIFNYFYLGVFNLNKTEIGLINMICLGIQMIEYKKSKSKYHLIFVVTALLGMLLLQSKTSFILSLFLIFNYTFLDARLYKLSAFIATLSSIIGIFLLRNFNSISARIEIWKGGIELIKENFWTGYGFDTLHLFIGETLSSKFFHLERSINIIPFNLHNEFLQYIYEFGLIGLAIYASYLLLNIYLLKENKEIGILITLITINNFINFHSKLTFILTILLIVNSIKYEKNITINKQLYKTIILVLISINSFWLIRYSNQLVLEEKNYLLGSKLNTYSTSEIREHQIHYEYKAKEYNNLIHNTIFTDYQPYSSINNNNLKYRYQDFAVIYSEKGCKDALNEIDSIKDLLPDYINPKSIKYNKDDTRVFMKNSPQVKFANLIEEECKKSI